MLSFSHNRTEMEKSLNGTQIAGIFELWFLQCVIFRDITRIPSVCTWSSGKKGLLVAITLEATMLCDMAKSVVTDALSLTGTERIIVVDITFVCVCVCVVFGLLPLRK